MAITEWRGGDRITRWKCRCGAIGRFAGATWARARAMAEAAGWTAVGNGPKLKVACPDCRAPFNDTLDF